jgi:hypothetical protein
MHRVIALGIAPFLLLGIVVLPFGMTIAPLIILGTI